MRLTPKILAYLTLLVYWGPSTPLYYFWGFILLFFLLFFKKSWLKTNGIYSRNILQYSILFIILFFMSSLINFPFQNNSLNNLIWSIFTYGSSFLVLIIFMMLPIGAKDLKKIFMFSLYLTLIQVPIGYIQMLESQSFQYLNPFSGGQDAGDAFVGTTFNIGIGSLVAIKMALTTFLFIPFWMNNKNMKNTIALILLFVGWILSSAIFSIVIAAIVIFYFFVLKKVIASFYTHRISKYVFYSIIIAGLGIVIFILTQHKNVEYLYATTKYAYYTIINKPDPMKVESRKVYYYKTTFLDFPSDYPHAVVLGVGPGNYSSRSAWMVSGHYLENQPSYMPATPSKAAEKHILPIWSKDMISEGFRDAGSITHQPFSTWLSVFAETGIVGVLLFYFIFRRFQKAFKVLENSGISSFYTSLATGLRMSLVFILLLFFLENLFEYPLVMGQFFVFGAVAVRILETYPNNKPTTANSAGSHF